MNNKLMTYFNGIKGKRIAFCGIGVSNRPLIMMYKNQGAKVIACDRRERTTFSDIADEFEENGVELKLGGGYLDNLEADIVFRTPGMNYNLPELKALREKGVEITSEMEEFFKLCPAKIIAVTGSDGKTTTTTIISELLKKQGKKVFLGGNIGTPLLPQIEKIGCDDFVVVELSSFQLISMRKSPQIAVVTNIAPNHLDVHKDMNEYIEAKKNVFIYQNSSDRLILNTENSITAGFIDEARGEVISFAHDKGKGNCVYINGNNKIVVNYSGENTIIMDKNDIRIPGDHNIQNYMAAIAAVWGIVSVENIDAVAKEFGGVEHRIEFVRELCGVKWYNDSIATSPTRSIAGIESFDKPLIIIAGGYDKHIPFEPFAKKVVTNVKTLILMGATADAIEKSILEQPDYNTKTLNIIRVNSMEEAVKTAYETAKEGEIVSLSPACASFDKYANFAERGYHFKRLVNAL